MKDFSEDFYGHVILYCKNHYTCKNGLIYGLRRMFAARCGVPSDTNDMDDNIANRLFNLCIITTGMGAAHLMSVVHREISKNHDGIPTLHILIKLYASYVAFSSVKDDEGNVILKLPKPKKRVYNKILNAKDFDYAIYNEMV